MLCTRGAWRGGGSVVLAVADTELYGCGYYNNNSSWMVLQDGVAGAKNAGVSTKPVGPHAASITRRAEP